MRANLKPPRTRRFSWRTRTFLAALVLLAIALTALALLYQHSTPTRTTASTTFTWTVRAPANQVHVVTLGTTQYGSEPWQENWYPAINTTVTVPMTTIAHGCGVAEELRWPVDSAGSVQPQHVRRVWLSCW